MKPRETIVAFDEYLVEYELSLVAVVVGGAALGLLGITERQTRDVDVLAPVLPEPIRLAAAAFAGEQRARGNPLADDWLNNGPSQLTEILPEGWEDRAQSAFAGKALELSTLGRSDLLKVKLFALCDRGTDLGDCLALSPTAAELPGAEAWVARQDAHPGWPDHVRRTLRDLRRRLAHGLP